MAASALPVSLSAVMLNRASATPIIGTITMIMKNSNRRLRKLIFLADPVPLKLLCPYGLTFRRQPFVRRLHRTMQVAGATIRSAVRGAIAQLGERLDRTQEVAGSSPASSTSAWPCDAVGSVADARGTARRAVQAAGAAAGRAAHPPELRDLQWRRRFVARQQPHVEWDLRDGAILGRVDPPGSGAGAG